MDEILNFITRGITEYGYWGFYWRTAVVAVLMWIIGRIGVFILIQLPYYIFIGIARLNSKRIEYYNDD